MRTAIAIIVAVLLCTGCRTVEPLSRAQDKAAQADGEFRAALAQVTDVTRRATLHFALQGAEPGTPETHAASAAALAVAEVAGAPTCPLDDWREPSGAITELQAAVSRKRQTDAELGQVQSVANDDAAVWKGRALKAEKENKATAPFKPVIKALFWILMGAIVVITVGGAGFNYLTKNIVVTVLYGAVGLPLAVAWWFHGEAWVGWGLVILCLVSLAHWLYTTYYVAACKLIVSSMEAAMAKHPDAAKIIKDALAAKEGMPSWVERVVARIKAGFR